MKPEIVIWGLGSNLAAQRMKLVALTYRLIVRVRAKKTVPGIMSRVWRWLLASGGRIDGSTPPTNDPFRKSQRATAAKF